MCCYCCLCWSGDRWRWAPRYQPQMWVFQGNHRIQSYGMGFFQSLKARREGKTCKGKTWKSLNLEMLKVAL